MRDPRYIMVDREWLDAKIQVLDKTLAYLNEQANPIEKVGHLPLSDFIGYVAELRGLQLRHHPDRPKSERHRRVEKRLDIALRLHQRGAAPKKGGQHE